MNNVRNQNRKIRIYFYILSAALLVAVASGLIFGSVNIPLKEVIGAVIGRNASSKAGIIIRTVRLPRVIAGFLAGAGLGTAGVIIQSVMNNSLASPNTIGVNSGAGFFVMLSMMIFPQSLIAKPLMAFVGAMLTSTVILCIAYIAEKSRVTIVLAGIAVSSFLSAGMNMMRVFDTDMSVNATQFLVGSLSGVTMKALRYPSVGIVCAIIVAIFFGKALNLLALGDGVASSLGLRVNLFRIIFVIIASVLSGFVVSFSGLIGFVGLIVPHICRYFFGHDSRVLVPAAALMGAVFVLVCDLFGRVVFAPYELPVGIILSLMGAPFFLYLLMRKGGRRVNA